MSLSDFFLKAALIPTTLAFIFLGGKGCGQAILFTGDDQEGMSIAEKTTDNVFDDLAGIVRLLSGNVEERIPEEARETLNNRAREVKRHFEKKNKYGLTKYEMENLEETLEKLENQ